MNAQQRRAWELILKYRDFYGTYQNHKEAIGYTATVLYLGAASAVLAGTFWADWTRCQQAALAFGVVGAAAIALAFAVWQLDRRTFAVNMVAACTDLAAKWLTTPPSPADLQARPLELRQWPAALVEQFHVSQNRAPFLPRYLTMGAILLWTAAAVARLVAG